MKVFLSWSGERSQVLARALRDWLPLVLHYVQPWLSQADINAGERWGAGIARELDESSFGIACVTSDNINAPWLLFEAGALAKSMQEGRVVPLLLDIDFQQISGPLAQFQAKKVEQDGIRDLANSINLVAASPVPEPRLQQLFDALWPEMERALADIPKVKAGAKQPRPQGEVLEELVSAVRNLEIRYRDFDERGHMGRRRSKRAYAMSEELVYRLGKEEGNPINILIAASYLKDDAPWFYELCEEIYRARQHGRVKEARVAFKRLMQGVESVQRSPWMDEFGPDPHLMHMIAHNLERNLSSWSERPAGRSIKGRQSEGAAEGNSGSEEA